MVGAALHAVLNDSEREVLRMTCTTCGPEAGIVATVESFTHEFDTEYQSQAVCPHCGSVNYDSWELFNEGDDEDTITQCGHCERLFHVSRIVEVTYTSVKPTEPICMQCWKECELVVSRDTCSTDRGEQILDWITPECCGADVQATDAEIADAISAATGGDEPRC